jgi:violaxanthin de-epoxidase
MRTTDPIRMVMCVAAAATIWLAANGVGSFPCSAPVTTTGRPSMASRISTQSSSLSLSSSLLAISKNGPKDNYNHDDNNNNNNNMGWMIHNNSMRTTVLSVALGLSVLTGGGYMGIGGSVANAASDPNAIVGCLFQKCSVPLAKCIASPQCLANVICINTCNNRPDEIDCQIGCGDIFDNPVIAEFNKCAVSDMSCVPQQVDTGLYPVPSPDVTVPKFNTNFFNGRLYITAGALAFFNSHSFPLSISRSFTIVQLLT